MIKCIHTALLALLALALPAGASTDANPPPAAVAETAMPASTSTADHGSFKVLQQNFKSGPEVTRACLGCHTEAAKQVHKSKHWTWEFLNPETGQRLGKKHVINNFCTAVPSNYEFCTACHVGYGWKDQNFDWSAMTPPAPTVSCRAWRVIRPTRTWNSHPIPARS